MSEFSVLAGWDLEERADHTGIERRGGNEYVHSMEISVRDGIEQGRNGPYVPGRNETNHSGFH